jgi:superfamily II DNA or RNA helicase
VLEKRTELVACKITEFLKATDRFDKTIVFCEDIDHAERMRQALVNENGDLVLRQPQIHHAHHRETTPRARPSWITSSLPESATRSSPPPPS